MLEYKELFEILGWGSHTLGAVMVAFTAIQVHMRVWQEHKIDEQVFKEMRHERRVGMIGVGLMIVGFIVHFVRLLV